MNKKIIALAVAAATASTSVHALEVYNDETNTFSVGGRLAASAKFSDGENSLGSQSSRINFAFTHALDNGWDIGAIAEWGYDALASGDKDSHIFNRLGNVTADKEGIGQFTVGKAWSIHYDVTGKTDLLWVYGGDTAGNYDGIASDGGVHGTGRADDVVQYRTNIQGLQLGLQYQFEDKNDDYHRDYGYQAMAGYDFDFGLGLSAAYGETQFKDRADAKVANAVITYETEALYLAANYGQFRNHQNSTDYSGVFAGAGNNSLTSEGMVKEATGMEFFASYDINQFQLLAGYNHLEDDNSSAKYAYTTLGVAYFTGPVILAAEYKIDTSSKTASGSDADIDDELALLVRYNF
ncbi:porin [Photobacterium sanctipauli]|uniref:Porin n=1 Tax=Photobacterium sanctipauli TaxID=1342794 RepID=A0A2T3NZ77_9GAMM|nr:porin [Photobacterium sanctipauli]PSW21519.1 porin [Photobacterium sanctipauli]